MWCDIFVLHVIPALQVAWCRGGSEAVTCAQVSSFSSCGASRFHFLVGGRPCFTGALPSLSHFPLLLSLAFLLTLSFFSLFGALLFCGYILYDTSNIIKRMGAPPRPYPIVCRLTTAPLPLFTRSRRLRACCRGIVSCALPSLSSPRNFHSRRRYLDIINLFLFILRILGAGRK